MSFKVNYKGLKGYAEMMKGKKAEAERDLSWAYDNGLSKPEYLTAYGALLMQKADYQKCLEVYNRALENVDEYSGYYLAIKCSIITCTYKLGDIDTAFAESEALYNRDKSSTIYMLYGYFLMKKGRYEEAVKVNLEGYDYDEDDVAICDNLGQVYYLMGDMENAKKYFEKALTIKYNMPDSCYYLADIYLKEGETNKAFELLEEALDSPFSALTNVSREIIREKYDLVDKMIGDSRLSNE